MSEGIMSDVAYGDGIDSEVVASHGITSEEYAVLVRNLGRAPNMTELGIYSGLWSEHCSYKSTKVWLGELPVAGENVIHGPGENAGVLDIGDGMAVAFKIESHNHPSFIEPFQGAATGVGGIMRDVFAMGARPVANLNVLHFGEVSHPKTRKLVRGVVSGIGSYGNCTGVPTVAGETGFDAGFNDNILVNAMCVGLVRTENIFTAIAKTVGSVVMYVGGHTGRDGVHGASMASSGFAGDVEEDQRPSVQVGDPFLEKLLIEACLELVEEKALLAMQDMGAVGLTSSAVEMAARGGRGIKLNLDRVPCRETDMSAYEMMLSESQERMLVVIDPRHAEVAESIFSKWKLNAVAIGEITEKEHLVITHHGRIEADLPIASFESGAPRYRRPYVRTEAPSRLGNGEAIGNVVAPALGETEESVRTRNHWEGDIGGPLAALIGSPHLCSRRWIWQQYDRYIGSNTVSEAGSDAAVIRVPHHDNLAIAACVDSSPRYCAADPEAGAAIIVAEARRNLICAGSKPLAITNNLNFGNPEQPEVMGQIVAAVEGISKACRQFGLPVVSGNVSLYNETDGKPIPPTPVIGAVGIVADWRKSPGIGFRNVGDSIFLIGDTDLDLGQSLYARELLGIVDGAPPEINFDLEIRHGEFVLDLIEAGEISAVHDVSDGGLMVALAEMALSGDLGAEINCSSFDTMVSMRNIMFSESQSRYVVTASPGFGARIMERARSTNVAVRHLGMVAGKRFSFASGEHISLDQLRKARESFFPDMMLDS